MQELTLNFALQNKNFVVTDTCKKIQIEIFPWHTLNCLDIRRYFGVYSRKMTTCLVIHAVFLRVTDGMRPIPLQVNAICLSIENIAAFVGEGALVASSRFADLIAFSLVMNSVVAQSSNTGRLTGCQSYFDGPTFVARHHQPQRGMTNRATQRMCVSNPQYGAHGDALYLGARLCCEDAQVCATAANGSNANATCMARTDRAVMGSAALV
jgi:hypothetical protein